MTSGKFRVVLTDYEWPDLELETNLFNQVGADFVAIKGTTEDQLIPAVKEADGVICEIALLTRPVIENMARCKIISMNGIGYNNVDIQAATESGIPVVNCPDYCLDEVADHTIALVLCCARGIVQFDRKTHNHIWDWKAAGKLERIRGRTLSLLGFGNIPRNLANKAKPLGFNIIAHDPYVDDKIFGLNEVERVSFESLFRQADFLSIHTPLTKATVNLVSDNELKHMKSTAYVINTSRGSVLNENALLKALEQGTIRGAALDVMATEPPEFENPLLKSENVIITPHAAFYSEQSMEEVRRRAAYQVVQVIEGKLPVPIVNKDVLLSPRFRLKVGRQ